VFHHVMRSFFLRLFFLVVVMTTYIVSHSQITVTASAATTGPTNYTTLKAAFAAVNAGTHQGIISVIISANTLETGAVKLNASGTGSSSYTSLLVKPAPFVSPVIGIDSAIILDGADKVTFDGSNVVGGTSKNLAITSSSRFSPSLLLLNGACMNDIKYTLFQGMNINGAVIEMGTSTAATGNDNNIFIYNIITKALSSPLAGIINVGTAGKPNSWNSFLYNKISDFNTYGFADGLNGAGFSHDNVLQGNEFFQIAPQNSNLTAIFINNATGITDMWLASNNIHDLLTAFNSTVTGIDIAAVKSIILENNMVALTGDVNNIRGIVQRSAATKVHVFYNTVCIYGSTSGTSSSVCFQKSSSSFNDSLRNNIFVNKRLSAGTGTQYAIVHGAGGGMISSDYNCLFSFGSPTNQLGSVNNVNVISLTDWRTTTGNDMNSVSAIPNFVSSVNLHLVPGMNGGVNNKGISLPSVFDDFDNDPRSASTPDIGADEMADATVPLITYTPFLFTCSTSDRVLTATIVDETGVPVSGSLAPRIYYKKLTSLTWMSRPGILISGSSNSGTWNFTIAASDFGSLGSGDMIQYYLIAQDKAGPSPNIASLPTGAIASNVNTVTTHPASPESYKISSTLSGTFTVGAGGNYSTLTAAINAYNTSCLNGPVVFNLTDADYSVNETFPLSIFEHQHASAVNTLTIKPATGVTSTIHSPNDIFSLLGGSYVTIDGSNNATTSKNLSIISTGGLGAVSIVFGGSFNTIKNSILKGGKSSSAIVGIDGSSDSHACSYNLIENNDISKANAAAIPLAGIIVGGESGKYATNNIIRGNRIFDFGSCGFWEGINDASTYTENTLFDSNELFFTIPVTHPITGIKIGVSSSGWNIKSTVISNNYFHDLQTTSGVAGIDLIWASIRIINNMIAIDNNGGGASGIITQTAPGYSSKVYFNTVVLTGNSIVSQKSYCYLKDYYSTADEVKNNIFVNKRTGGSAKQFAVGIARGGTTMISDYNVLVSTGNAIGEKYGTYYPTLPAWQATTSGDLNSTDVMPVFRSGTDLHLIAGSNIGIDNKGTPVAGITKDFDNESRNSTTPDIGADEMYTCSVSMTTLDSFTVCSGTSPNIVLTSNIAGTTYTWTVGTSTGVQGANAGNGSSINEVLQTISSFQGSVQYIVVPTTPAGCIGSPFVIKVIVNDSTSVNVNPVSINACDSSSTAFTVQASGRNLSYQWRFNGNNIPGANSNTYTINPVLPATIGNYDVIVTGTCGTKTSAAAVLTVHPTPVADFTPPAGNLCIGSSLAFTNTSNSSPGNMATAHWEFGDAATSNAATGTVNHTYSSSGPFNVSLEVTSIYGCKSNPLVKTINISPSTTITTQPANQAGCIGSSVNFSVVATGSALSFQWKKNNINISGATSNTYTINNATMADVANYSVEVTGACGIVTSGSVSFALIPPAQITVQPSDISVCAGSSASLSVSATGNGLSYQWRKSGNNIAGATSPTYTVNPFTSSDFGSYDVVISNSCGVTVISGAASFNMLPSPANFLPLDTAICSYGKLLLQSLQPYASYTWSSGATTPTLSIDKPGIYWLQVTDNSNCVGRDSIIVDPKDCMKGIYVPNAFTPNNDGKNDFFKTLVFGKTISFKLEVFERGGQLVFQTTDPKVQWDGNIKGSKLPTGAYVWICSYQLEGGSKEIQKGTVMLLR
jgi:gliding motility-associated-like protein